MSELPVLDPAEQRVLGSLLEKQVTVPTTYPLTLSALRTACNQASSRDPVVAYAEPSVEQTARGLKGRGLLRVVWAGAGQRTLKYHQLLEEVLEVDAAERALLTGLLLRGPQAPGELRARTERLHSFTDRAEVERVLTRMATRLAPLVRELPRRPGQHDSRWVHLLGPVDEADAATPHPPSTDREVVLASGGQARDERVRATYTAIATAYADRFADELGVLPFEAWLLRRVAELAGPHPVVEAGSGPGHITAFLADEGADATGLDLTPEMVAEARRRFPGGRYEVGDLTRLMRPPTGSGWGAVLAWYSLIHLAPSELPAAVEALARPLREDGWLVLALHTGDSRGGVRHLDSWFDHEVDVDVMLHDQDEVLAAVKAAGLVDVQWWRRGPVAAHDESTERLYLLARRPGR